MKTLSFTVKPDAAGRFVRRRAIELYHENSPFRGRKEESRITYRRREKHAKKGQFTD